MVDYYIYEVLKNVSNILSLLSKSTEIYFYQTMIRLFNDRENCLDYNVIYKNCIDTNLYKIVYRDITIYFTIFDKL